MSFITKSYADGQALVESDLDNIIDGIETKIEVTKLNDDNLQDAGITGSTKLKNTSVTAAKLASDSVTTTKIADSNVTTAKIADANVTTVKIADSNITTAKIADSNVTTAKIADANVTTVKIADDNVTKAKLASDVVDGSTLEQAVGGELQVKSGGITNTQLATGAALANITINTLLSSQLKCGAALSTGNAQRVSDWWIDISAREGIMVVDSSTSYDIRGFKASGFPLFLFRCGPSTTHKIWSRQGATPEGYADIDIDGGTSGLIMGNNDWALFVYTGTYWLLISTSVV